MSSSSTSLLVVDCAELRRCKDDSRAVAILPKWARFQFIEGYFGIGYRTLLFMVANGWVRMRKNGDGRNTSAIFNVADVDEAINTEWSDVQIDAKLHVSVVERKPVAPSPVQVLPTGKIALTANGEVMA